MKYIIFIIFIILIIWFFLKKNVPLFKNKNKIKLNIGNVRYEEREMTKEEEKYFLIKKSEILELLRNKMIASNFFTTNGINSIINIIELNQFFIKEKINISPYLTLEEKKKYSLNTKQKISKFLFDCYNDNGKKIKNPYNYLFSLYKSCDNKIFNKYKLIDLKEKGIKKVKIINCGDKSDCDISNKIKNKVWDIDNVPELPLEGCDAEYCRCFYIPVID